MEIFQSLGSQLVLTLILGSRFSLAMWGNPEKNALVLKSFLNWAKDTVGSLFGCLEAGINIIISPISLRNDADTPVFFGKVVHSRFVHLVK